MLTPADTAFLHRASNFQAEMLHLALHDLDPGKLPDCVQVVVAAMCRGLSATEATAAAARAAAQANPQISEEEKTFTSQVRSPSHNTDVNPQQGKNCTGLSTQTALLSSILRVDEDWPLLFLARALCPEREGTHLCWLT